MENEKIEITIPESWSDITLNKFIEFQQYDWNSMHPIDASIQQIGLILDIDPDTVSKMPISEFEKIYNHLSWIKTEPSPDFKRIFEIDGSRFGIIPDFSNITVAEWVDLEHLIGENTINNMSKLFSIFYRPIMKEDGEYYEIEEYNSARLSDRSILFGEKLSIDDVYGSLVFFCLLETEFIKEHPRCSLQELGMYLNTLKESQEENAQKE